MKYGYIHPKGKEIDSGEVMAYLVKKGISPRRVTADNAKHEVTIRFLTGLSDAEKKKLDELMKDYFSE